MVIGIAGIRVKKGLPISLDDNGQTLLVDQHDSARNGAGASGHLLDRRGEKEDGRKL